MNKTTEALKLAEEALTGLNKNDSVNAYFVDKRSKALAAIRAEALAEPVPYNKMTDWPLATGTPDYVKAEPVKQEPVAEVVLREQRVGFGREEERKDVKFLSDVEVGSKLYAAPVDAKAIRAEALEEAANVCEEKGPKEGSMKLISDGFAAAIRGLK